MADKKEQKPQNKKKDLGAVFEIHTMAKDNEINANAPQLSEKTVEQIPQDLPIKKNDEKKSFFAKKEQEKKSAGNPFLEQNSAKSDEKTSSFAPQKRSEPVEKINMSPEDIMPQDSTPQPPKKSHKGLYTVIVFIIIFILGAIGVLAYLYIDQQGIGAMQPQEIEVAVPDDVVDESPVEIEPEIEQQVYATDLPNYFQIDIESESTQAEVLAELDVITQNMEKEEISDPISFIVTDQNNNPVSFPIFALATGIDIPSDVLSNLEEDFELYAYMDQVHGVRFGLVIDVKNVNLLQEALTAQETQLPAALSLILNDMSIDQPIVFNDSAYNTYPIRYVNLVEDESYSIDYTVHNLRFFIGTTKDTLRAIIEDVRGGEYMVPDIVSDDQTNDDIIMEDDSPEGDDVQVEDDLAL